MSGWRIREGLFCITLLFASGELFLTKTCFGQDQINQNWAAQVQKKRQEAAEQAAKDPKNKATTQKTAAPVEGTAVIGGRKIKVRTIPTATPTLKPAPKAQPDAATDPAAATSETLAATMTPTSTPTLTATPTVTPTFIKIKRPKFVDGKIVMVEIEVTPTPAPAEEAASTAAGASAAIVIPATGEMAELRDRLFAAVKSASKPLQFTPKQTAKIREEVLAMTTRKKDQIKGILDATKTLQLQIKVNRMAANAKGAVIDSATARDLIKVIWPQYAHQLDKPQSVSKAVIQSGTREDATAESEADDIFLEEDEDETEYGDEPEIYIDPDTGKYVYEDGTPVEELEDRTAPAPAPPSRPVSQQPPRYNPPPEYYEPPPPPPPPPMEQGYIEEQGPIEDVGEYVEQDHEEIEYEEDPALQEEPQEYEEQEYVEPDDSHIEEYQEGEFVEYEEGDYVEQY